MTSTTEPAKGFKVEQRHRDAAAHWFVHTDYAGIILNSERKRVDELAIFLAKFEADHLAATPAQADAGTLVEAVKKAAHVFRTYGEMHRGRRTEEGEAKAIVNELLAEEMEAALSRPSTPDQAGSEETTS